MATKRKEQLEDLILKLLTDRSEISVPDVANAAGMSKSDEGDRKAIRRALNNLIEKGILETRGAARARTYFARSTPNTTGTKSFPASPIFKEIDLSKESNRLLEYVLKPVESRKPVGYNQDFLRSYEPNKIYYLSKEQRIDLLSVGKVQSQIQQAGTYARNILSRLLIDLSWNSSRLEGNTYSLLETKRLIELGESAAGKDASETQMIINHKGAIEYIIESAEEKKISHHDVLSIHALLSENLLGDPSASGRIRQVAVGLGGSTYLPLDNPHVLDECFQVFIEKLNLINDPFEQSLFSLVQLSYMQAFEDVNKRTARVVANIPLIKANLRPLSFMDVSNEAYAKSLIGIYEKNDVSLFRDLYLWAYKRSALRYSAIQQSMGEPNLLKLKYRTQIQDIIRAIILDKTSGADTTHRIRNLLEEKGISRQDTDEIFKIIETEIISLHDGNIARFKIRPSEFKKWKELQ